jgi:isoaspartyl peptidase/L-asparaginase-like protein (Ntn-hydrolase superfamily)
LLVGKGAQDFARNGGFTIEPDLTTKNSRDKWLEGSVAPTRCTT